ncbi:hypothetical protein L2E82_00629 [Cichorium intybus]|uniref:Uncharacterized protein n=1 Tax=Cichorium intybus TaxID=13427 RepID=A0ACB9GX52_CICIN|nr:hypothetical protein L2E82_00629 [Cichorium intybus]
MCDAQERFGKIRLQEYGTHDPKGHSPALLPFLKKRSNIIEIVAAHDIVFTLTESEVCAAFNRVSVYALDNFSFLKCRSTWIDYIARIQKLMSDEEKGKETIVDLTSEEKEKDEFLRLTIENKFLDCEKVKAETELHFLKEKVKQLVFQVCELESKLNMKGINENCSKVKRHLPFEEYGCSNKKFAPFTPGVAPPPSSNVIDLSDEDVDHNQIPKFLEGHSGGKENHHYCSFSSAFGVGANRFVEEIPIKKENNQKAFMRPGDPSVDDVSADDYNKKNNNEREKDEL